MTKLEYSSRIIHISDVHCTTRDYVVDKNIGAIVGGLVATGVTGIPIVPPDVVHGDDQDTRTKCQELVAFLTSNGPVLRSDRIVITGDLVDEGGYAAFRALALECLIDPLSSSGFDVILVPGNHDYFTLGHQWATGSIAAGREAFFNEFSTYLKTDAPDAYPVDVDLGGGNHLILLDSFKGHYDVSTDASWAQGNIGARQMAWLRNTLPGYQAARWGGAKVAIALHNSPFDTDSFTELADAREFLEVVENRVDALLFGHVGPPQWFYAQEALDLKIPIINSEDIAKMQSNGYAVSVIDLVRNHVEVYSTGGGPPVIHAVPDFAYGSQGEAGLIELALDL